MGTQKPPRSTEDHNTEHFECILSARCFELMCREDLKSTSSDSQPDRRTSCVFDGMTAVECKEAVGHYHTHPDELPERRKFADVRASLPAREVKIKFDEGVFDRQADRASEDRVVEGPVSPKTQCAEGGFGDGQDKENAEGKQRQ